MNDIQSLRRVATVAIVLLVLLRISIGWQFLYEGLWKINTQNDPQPWTSKGYLVNAQGPFRNMFVDLAGGDPHDLNWIDYEKVAAEWDAWHQRFLNHYPNLTDNQKKRLDEALNGKEHYHGELKTKDGKKVKWPESVPRLTGTLAKLVKYDDKRMMVFIDGKEHLIPREREILLRKIPSYDPKKQTIVNGTPEEYALFKAVKDAYTRNTRLSYKEKAMALLEGDPDLAGARFGEIRDENQEDLSSKLGPYERFGDIQKYKRMVAKYEQDLDKAETKSDFDHLEYTLGKIRSLKSQLVGPVRALDTELKTTARELLTPEQLAAGRVPPEPTTLTRSDNLTIWMLTVLGILLMIGLGTRVAAIIGAGMLMSFYLVWPPWPGVPEAPGPEHSFIVNKNLIEAIALLAIAALPTGSWFGIDGLFRRCFAACCGKKDKQPSGKKAKNGTSQESGPTSEKPLEKPASATR